MTARKSFQETSEAGCVRLDSMPLQTQRLRRVRWSLLGHLIHIPSTSSLSEDHLSEGVHNSHQGDSRSIYVRKALIGTFIRFRFAAFSLTQGYRLFCHKYLLQLNV